MNNRTAKLIRKSVYGDRSFRATKYYRKTKQKDMTIHTDEYRKTYQTRKKHYKELNSKKREIYKQYLKAGLK